MLETRQLTKRFGSLTAVDELDLSVPKGSVFGVLGPNGSGKTTTLGMVLGVIHATSGHFRWFGREAVNESRKRIGAILETPNFYPYLSGEENLRVAAAIKEAPESNIEPVLKRVGLHDRRRDAFRKYSLGMKQRLAIGSALLGEPEVLVLDEPTNGLDPQGIADVRRLIVDIGKEGRTIILASHLLDEVQKVCSDFAVLRDGRLLHSGSVEESLGGEESVEVAAADLDALATAVRAMDGVAELEEKRDCLLVRFAGQIDVARFHRGLIHQGVVLTRLIPRRKDLEKQFLEILDQSP